MKAGGRTTAALHYFACKSHFAKWMHFWEQGDAMLPQHSGALLQHPARQLLQGNVQETSYWAIMGKPVQIQILLPAPLSVNKNWHVLKHGGLYFLKHLFQVLPDVCNLVFSIPESLLKAIFSQILIFQLSAKASWTHFGKGSALWWKGTAAFFCKSVLKGSQQELFCVEQFWKSILSGRC